MRLLLSILLLWASTTKIIVEADEFIPNKDLPECNAPNLQDTEAGIDAPQTCIDYDGLTRCWYSYVPESITKLLAYTDSMATSFPLVMDLHGYNLCAAQSANYTGWSRIADQFGFIVVYPQGNLNSAATNEPCWSFGDCCCSIGDAPEPPPSQQDVEEGTFAQPPSADIDDVGFLNQVISNTVKALATHPGIVVDTKRLYFAGHSNGCMMAQAMAALNSSLVAAVCCHASSLMIPPADNYTATPVQVVYGDLDVTIDFFFGNKSHILDTWGPINQCLDQDATTTVVDATGLYATHTLAGCDNDATVQTVELYNVGHFSYLGIPPDTPL